MEAQERGGFQDDGDTDQPSRARAVLHAGDHPISEAEVGGTSPRAIEDQELLLDDLIQPRCWRTARPDEPDGRHEVQKQTARSLMTQC
jgi:hypothetical protein